jgi:hypothetical protein
MTEKCCQPPEPITCKKHQAEMRKWLRSLSLSERTLILPAKAKRRAS